MCIIVSITYITYYVIHAMIIYMYKCIIMFNVCVLLASCYEDHIISVKSNIIESSLGILRVS